MEGKIEVSIMIDHEPWREFKILKVGGERELRALSRLLMKKLLG